MQFNATQANYSTFLLLN